MARSVFRAAGRPTIFVGNRDDLLALDPAVQAMAAEFLMDSWQPEEALVRLSLALAHSDSAQGSTGAADTRRRAHSCAGCR